MRVTTRIFLILNEIFLAGAIIFAETHNLNYKLMARRYQLTSSLLPPTQRPPNGQHPDSYYDNNFLYWFYSVWANAQSSNRSTTNPNRPIDPEPPQAVFFDRLRDDSPPFIVPETDLDFIQRAFDYFNDPTAFLCHYMMNVSGNGPMDLSSNSTTNTDPFVGVEMGPPFGPSSGPSVSFVSKDPQTVAICYNTFSDYGGFSTISPLISPFAIGDLNKSNATAESTAKCYAYDNKIINFNTFESILIMALTVFSSVFTAVGNGMVLLSFFLERQLRQATNYFIGSLSMTGFLIGIFSMNLFSVYLVNNSQWPLPRIACSVWLDLDFIVCLASQYTVFFITLDRYCSVKYPAQWRIWRTDTKVKVMIALAWIVPVVLFSPVVLGWQWLQPLLAKVLPKVRIREDSECVAEFMEDRWIATCITFCYYWVTLAIMMYLYYEIYAVAVKMAKKSAEKRKNVANLFAVAEQGVTRIGVGLTTSLSPPGGPGGQPGKPGQKPNTDQSTSSNPQQTGGQQRTSSVRHNRSDGEKSESALLGSDSDADQTEPSKKKSGGPGSTAGTNSAGKGSSSKAAGRSSEKGGGGEKAAADKSQRGKKGVFDSFSRRFASFKARGRSTARPKEKKKVENRARKALKTVTLIMGLYAICWTPYHIIVIVNGFTTGNEDHAYGYIFCEHFHLYNLAYWACYLNSPINPFSYAFVNVHFKKTFLRILKFDFSSK